MALVGDAYCPLAGEHDVPDDPARPPVPHHEVLGEPVRGFRIGHRPAVDDVLAPVPIDVDDEGVYLREERIFAFEESIAFENGRLTGDHGVALDLVNLKGAGRALVQLEGTLKAMPIPAGAPMLVPLNRLVGWFGYVTPRVVAFAAQGAVELTGEGFALLGAPAERG